MITDQMYYFSGNTISGRRSIKPDSLCWEVPVDASGDLIVAGDYLFAGGNHSLSMLKRAADQTEPKMIWQKEIDGQVGRLIAANGYLVAVTEGSKIAAFGTEDINVQNNRSENKSFKPSAAT